MMFLAPLLLLQAAAPPVVSGDVNDQLYKYRKCVGRKASAFAMKELWREGVATVVNVAMLACRHDRTRYVDALEAANAKQQVGMDDGNRAKVLLQFIDRIEGTIIEETSAEIVRLRGEKGL